MNPAPISPARIVEVGGVTAGIAVPEGGRLRFFSAERSFASLDQRTYASLGQVNAAARACLQRSQGRSRTPPRRDAAAGCDARCPRAPWPSPTALGDLARDDHHLAAG